MVKVLTVFSTVSNVFSPCTIFFLLIMEHLCEKKQVLLLRGLSTIQMATTVFLMRRIFFFNEYFHIQIIFAQT